MAETLKGKGAVVTGSGRNIGRAIALLMAQEGARVVTNNRAPGGGEGDAGTVAKEISDAGGTATAVFSDVSTMEGAKQLTQAALDTHGAIDILVNNAAFSTRGDVDVITGEQWDEVLGACLRSQFACARYAVPGMKARGWGRIINVSSRVGLYGFAGMAAYSAAKAGTVGLTLAMAHELGKFGITANCIAPTATTSRGDDFARFAAGRTTVSHAPSAKRLPEHIAPLVTYLASEAAPRATGQSSTAPAVRSPCPPAPFPPGACTQRANGRWRSWPRSFPRRSARSCHRR